MKKLFSLLATVSFFVALQAQNLNRDPYLTQSLSKESIQQIQVQTSGGSISVSSANEDARIEMYVTPNSGISSFSKDEIKKRLEEYYKIKITVDGNSLTASAKAKDNLNWKNSLNISFKIFVPGNVSTNLSTSGGSINLNGLSGTQNFTTSGGSLHLDNLSGRINGRTSGGSIHLSNSHDDIDLSTSGGKIEAEKCTGAIKLSTSGGSLNLNDLDGNVDASTSGGYIAGDNIKGELSASTSGGYVKLTNINATLRTSTTGGSMNIEVENPGKFVKIHNSGGDVHVQLPANKGFDLQLSGQRVKTDKLSNFSGSVKEDNVDGKMNGGGIPVIIDASSGTVSLTLN